MAPPIITFSVLIVTLFIGCCNSEFSLVFSLLCSVYSWKSTRIHSYAANENKWKYYVPLIDRYHTENDVCRLAFICFFHSCRFPRFSVSLFDIVDRSGLFSFVPFPSNLVSIKFMIESNTLPDPYQLALWRLHLLQLLSFYNFRLIFPFPTADWHFGCMCTRACINTHFAFLCIFIIDR